jgi:hypothetical protein
MEVIGILDIGEAVVPPDDSITTAKIQDDAVTAAKLANSINTEITANTAKVTNATHTGDVTGATALTIATDAVDIAMLSATGTASSSTFLRGDNAWATAGGNSPAFWATLATSQSISDNTVTKITMDTEEYDSAGDYDHTTNYRFTPTTAGTYYLFASLLAELSDQMYRFQVYIKKNGSNWLGQTGQANTGAYLGKGWANAAGIDTANGTSDYYEVFVWGDTGNGSNSSVYGNSEGAKFANFGGFKIG